MVVFFYHPVAAAAAGIPAVQAKLLDGVPAGGADDQLSLFEYWMHRLGKVKRELFERTYFGDYCVYTKLRKLALDLFIRTVLHILNKAHKKVYGEETPAELVKEVKRVINKF